jgi:hypothetical protein
VKKIILFALLIVCSYSAFGKTKDPAGKSYKGYLMDKMCAKRRVGDMEKMKAHTKTCLVEDACAASGYGVIVGKKFIPFDAKGNELAAAYIKSSPKDNDFQIEATGSMKKNKLAVTAIK